MIPSSLVKPFVNDFVYFVPIYANQFKYLFPFILKLHNICSTIRHQHRTDPGQSSSKPRTKSNTNVDQFWYLHLKANLANSIDFLVLGIFFGKKSIQRNTFAHRISVLSCKTSTQSVRLSALGWYSCSATSKQKKKQQPYISISSSPVSL